MKNEQNNVVDELIKDQLRINGYNLLKILISTQTPFRLVIWNNNDWDVELPQHVMDHYKNELVIDIIDDTLAESYIDDNNEVVINTIFDDEEYSKIINPGDIIAILDLANKPIHLNQFKYKHIDDYQNVSNVIEINNTHDMYNSQSKTSPSNIKELIQDLVKDGISEEAAKKSIEAFKKHNKGKFKILN